MDWIYIAVMTLLIGGFVWLEGYLCVQYGIELGQKMAQVQPQRARVSTQNNSGAQPIAPQRCPECQTVGTHHPDCPSNVKAPTAHRRRGFSAIKRTLESQESNNASN